MTLRDVWFNCLKFLCATLLLGTFSVPFCSASGSEPAPAPAAIAAVSLEQGKTLLIRKIIAHVRWPNDSRLDTLTLGYYGNNSVMFRTLLASLNNKKIRDKDIRVVRLRTVSETSKVQVLVVDMKLNARLASFARVTKGAGTLIISERSIDKHHVMINFVYPTKESLAFEINRASLLVEGFSLTKDITLYGGTELDGALLFKETEKELAEALELAKRQQDNLLDQQEKLAAQQSIIDQQNSSISRQLDTIKTQGSKITERERVLQTLERNMEKIKLALDGKSKSLKQNEAVLSSQMQEIDAYTDRIEKNVQRLSRQNQRLEAQENLITDKNSQLTLHMNTIADQRLVLIVAILTLLVVIFLAGLLFRAIREKNLMNKRLESMAEARGRFLSTMSHEIRTPLNGVLGILDLLQDTSLDKQQTYYLNTMHASGDLLVSVINDILDFTKIDAGKMPIERLSFDLHQLFNDCATIFNLQDHPGVDFECVIATEMPHHVWGDPTRLRQILLNLLSNAFKFTDKGRVKMELGLSSDPSKFRLCVSDTGIGISDEQRAGLFSAFGQADRSITRRFGGTGLGLAICAKLVELMAGTIRLTSEEGKGSTFTVELPLELVPVGEGGVESSGANTKRPLSDSLSSMPSFTNSRVLLVEDNPTNRLVAVGMLKRFGIVPDVADDGQEALDLYQAAREPGGEPYDLILMDCEMPVMDGFSASKAIRHHEQQHKAKDAVPIVALTAHALSEHRKLGRAAGMNEHLAKPLKSDALKLVLTQFLS